MMSRRHEMPKVLFHEGPLPLFARVAMAMGWRECVSVRHESDFGVGERSRWLGVRSHPTPGVAHEEIPYNAFPVGDLISRYLLFVTPGPGPVWNVTSDFHSITTASTLQGAVYAHIADAYELGKLPT